VQLGCCAAIWRASAQLYKEEAEEADGDEETNAAPAAEKRKLTKEAVDKSGGDDGGEGVINRKLTKADRRVQEFLSQPLDKYGSTLLHLSVRAAQDDKDPAGQCCNVLLRCLADVKKRNSMGDTPLHVAGSFALQKVYDLIFQELCKSLGSRRLAHLQATEDRNTHGRTPKELLAAKTKRLLREEEMEKESDLLKALGFLAFGRNRLFTRLELWRSETGPTWYDVIQARHREIRQLLPDEGSSDSSDGEGSDSPFGVGNQHPGSRRDKRENNDTSPKQRNPSLRAARKSMRATDMAASVTSTESAITTLRRKTVSLAGK
jgi:hypothetical protein